LINVLFVCLGNICRSPMAEAMFRDLVKRERLEDQIKVDSAGTGDYHTGQPPHHGTQKVLRKYQIEDKGLIARQIQKADLNEFDYIIAMDSENVENIIKLGPLSSNTKVTRLLDFVENNTKKDVPDPYFTGNFEEVYELIKEGCVLLLEQIKKDIKEKANE
jgi:protein-tyrosine phosphatase